VNEEKLVRSYLEYPLSVSTT